MRELEILLEGETWPLDGASGELTDGARLSEDRRRLHLNVPETLDDDAAIALAHEFVDCLNGAIRVREQNVDCPKLRITRVTIRDGDRRRELISGKALIRKPLDEKRYRLSSLLHLARSSPKIHDLLVGLSSDHGFWVKAYSALDTINAHFPDVLAQLQADPQFREQHGRLIGTANNFRSLLSEARHGVLKEKNREQKEHSNPMSTAEARAHLNTLLQAVITHNP